MSIFKHSIPKKIYKDYSRYREMIRSDFSKCCAYCLLPELKAAGEENFEIDHREPKSKFPLKIAEYTNLYYSCHPCNHIKGNHWPSENLIKQGVTYLDHCNDDFTSSYSIDLDGKLHPLSRSAKYTIMRVRLNRTHLKKIRKALITMSVKNKSTINWDKNLNSQLRAFS